MRQTLRLLVFAMLMAVGTSNANAQKRAFKHPGISYTQADIDRMKAMVEAKQEPFYSGYLSILNDSYYTNYKDITRAFPKDKNGKVNLCGSDSDVPRQLWFERFGLCALNNALLWRITGNTTYADRAVTVLNRYIGIESTWSYGTVCLNNGAANYLIEAAELMRDYSGWKAKDQQGFKDFLVYPGYSSKEVLARPSNTPEENHQTVYWGIYNGDPDRHGNQGLYGLRTLLAMGIYLDNDTIYDRALNKLLSQPHRADDLPYPGENQTGYAPDKQNEYFESWNLSGEKVGEDYGADDEIKYYFYENGQCQESSRDQGHILDGICYAVMPIARMAWNQGDDLYTQFDDRILKGINFTVKYNYGWLNDIKGEPYWQGEEVFEPTVENGQFLSVRSRNKRWRCLKINPWDENIGSGNEKWSRGKRFKQPVQMYIDYKVRVGRSDDSLLWVKRAYDMDLDSINNTASADMKNFLLDYRTPWMAGDGGTYDSDGKHVSGLPTMPGTINAANYDYHPLGGEGLTHSGSMTTDGTALTGLSEGSWMSYTVIFPQTGYYTFTAEGTGSKVGFAVDGSSIQWTTFGTASTAIKVQQGARVIRVYIGDTGAEANASLFTLHSSLSEAPTEPTSYEWNSRDYESTSGMFLTDASSHSLYSTAYGSTTSATFTMEAASMNYTVPTASKYLVMRGTQLASAALRKAVYRLDGATADVTKTVTTPQTNHKTVALDNGETLLLWKLDSTTNARIKPLFQECYNSTAPNYTLRGLSIAVTGKTVHLPTTINEVQFYDLQSLYGAYPQLNPEVLGISSHPSSFTSHSLGVYDLQGRCVDNSSLKPGLYICNGRKVFVK